MAENSFSTSNSIKKECYENWSSTQINVVRLRHTWTISNFSFCSEKVGEELLSPIFLAGTDSSKSEWRLKLYPKGQYETHSDAIALYFNLITFNMSEIRIMYKLGIVNAKGQDVNVYEDLVRFEDDHKEDDHDVYYSEGYFNFVMKDVLFNEENKLLSNDTLTIFCEIIYTGEREHISGTLTIPESDLERDFQILFENKDLSDVTLSVDGKEIQTHKLILTARSPVFRAMFQHDMKETKTNRVEITDTDEESVCEMLRYMYTGKINKIKTMAPRLFGIAEKYEMDGLKIMCEKAMFESLSFENAAEFLILSDTFGAKQLKQQVKDFIIAHASDVGNTPGFQEMARTHPHLSVEAFCVLSNSSID